MRRDERGENVKAEQGHEPGFRKRQMPASLILRWLAGHHHCSFSQLSLLLRSGQHLSLHPTDLGGIQRQKGRTPALGLPVLRPSGNHISVSLSLMV